MTEMPYVNNKTTVTVKHLDAGISALMEELRKSTDPELYIEVGFGKTYGLVDALAEAHQLLRGKIFIVVPD